MSPRKPAIFAAALAAAGITCAALGADTAADGAADKASNVLAHEIFKELIEINTTDSAAGNVTTGVEAMAKRFRDAGFPVADVVVLGPENPKKKNLVVRLRGSGKHKPVLLIGHVDVVEAHREDWNLDPFKLTEQEGYFYGRGTSDMKGDDAIMVATLLRMKKEGYKPDRDIILALTADEEGGCCNGPAWLVKNHKDLIDAAFVINTDGWSVNTDNKVSRPYYEQEAAQATGQRQADIRGILKTPPDEQAVQRLSKLPADNSVMRTNCVATRLDGGHANNALPQRAQANVNCRILPGHSLEEVRQQLIKVVADPEVTVRYVADDGKVAEKTPDRVSIAPPPLNPEVLKPLEAVVAQMWPGIKVVPYMDAGASDSIYTSAAGMPSYGITGIAVDFDDVRAHGRDERIRVASFYKGNEFFYRFMKALTSQ
jgi:acetylornithine deacetylase/succinyl-diaminopimelate desuccinylase-like protein